MFVGVMELHLVLYDNESLKAKRSVVKRISHRCRNTFNVSVAEVYDHDLTDRAVLAVVSVNSNRPYLEGLLSKIENFVERLALADLVEASKIIENY
ncbi:MAG: DUF503 domain-containing protein [Myxococcota bacterium]